MYSRRFGKPVVVTNHARARMRERSVSDADLVAVVEEGDIKWAGAGHLFIYRRAPERRDNLICAAAVDEARLVIKTVMVYWKLRGEP